MPGPYGLTASGFNPKSLQEIKLDLETAWRGVFGAGADVSENSVDGQIIGIMADRFADLWQLAAALYAAAYPDGASGVQQDKVAGITGTVRKPATLTNVKATLMGVPGTLIPQGSRASVSGQGTLFASANDYTIPIGGSLADCEFASVEAGPKFAPAGLLTVIETPVAGWTSITNPADQYQLGTYAETDPQLRIRRELDLRQIGASAIDAIRAGVLSIPGVTFADVTENVTEATVDGVGPHGIEAVVIGGSNDAIAQVIWDRKPAGNRAYGAFVGTALDSLGLSHLIPFSRPSLLTGYVTIDVTVNANAPENIADLIVSAVVAFGDLNLTVGAPLVAQALVPTVFGAGPGVVDVAPPKIGLAPSPGTSTTITPTRRQFVDLDTSRVVVNVSRVG